MRASPGVLRYLGGVLRPFIYFNGKSVNENFDKLVTSLRNINCDDKATFVGGDFNLDFNRLRSTDYQNHSQLIRLEV